MTNTRNICKTTSLRPNLETNKSSQFYLKILHQNVRFCLNKKNEITVLCENIDPHVLCMSEVALKKYEIEQYVINNYQLVCNYCRSDINRGGGVCIYTRVHSNFQCKPLDLSEYCVDKLIEVCGVKIKCYKQNLIVICVYRTPNSSVSEVKLFFKKLSELIENLNITTEKIVITGDFNICVLTNDHRYVQLNEFLNLFNLNSTINVPTRITHLTKSAIDNIFTNIDDTNYVTKVHNTCISDHCGVSIDIECSASNNSEIIYKNSRQFKNENYNLFEYYLKNEMWDNVLNVKSDINQSFNMFHDSVLCYYNLSFPKMKKRVNPTRKRHLVFNDSKILLQQDRVRFLHELHLIKPSSTLKKIIHKETQIYKSILQAKMAEIVANKMS